MRHYFIAPAFVLDFFFLIYLLREKNKNWERRCRFEFLDDLNLFQEFLHQSLLIFVKEFPKIRVKLNEF